MPNDIDEQQLAEDREALVVGWFEKHEGDYLKFKQIPSGDRRHPRPDLCAMLYLHERFGGKHDMIVGAEHDVIWLGVGVDEVTENDVIYLNRCGVHYDEESSSLAMFV